VTFSPGEVVKTVRIPIIDNSVVESVESFKLYVNTPSANATISDTQASATIIDNDAPKGTPAATITDAYVDEANQTVTVSVILDKPSASSVSFNLAGQGITAVEGSDFQNTPFGKIAFAPGEMVKTVTFALLNDSATENAELFDVVLSNPVGATISDGRAHVVIAANDAAQVALQIINVANVEAVENQGYVDFLVTLSAPSNNTVRVSYSTLDGTATRLSDSDYVTRGGKVDPKIRTVV
jgi:Calx-beta domain